MYVRTLETEGVFTLKVTRRNSQAVDNSSMKFVWLVNSWYTLSIYGNLHGFVYSHSA